MTKSGFSLMELMVAIALIGAVAAIVVPRLVVKSPKKEREQFILHLNNLTRIAWQNAVTSQKICKVEFDLSREKREIFVSESIEEKNKEGKLLFKPLKKRYINTIIDIPTHFSFKNFYIEGFDEITGHGVGKKVTGLWFYIIPEGLSQSVIINFVDTKSKKLVGLKLNPFSVQFKAYDSFQKP